MAIISGRGGDMVSFVPSIAQSAKSGDIRDLKETIEKIVKRVKYFCSGLRGSWNRRLVLFMMSLSVYIVSVL